MFETGPIINVISSLLDPSPIYEMMTYFSFFSSLIFFLFPLFLAVRLAADASTLGFGSSAKRSFSDFASTPVQFLIYSVVGVLMFQMIFFVQGLFERYGSVELIEQSLTEFRHKIVHTEKQQEDWIMSVLRVASDVGSTITAPIFLLAYEIVSTLFILVKHIMKVIFAIAIVLTYAIGYVAILSKTLPKPLNIVNGFLKTFLTLAIWAILEPIVMGLVYVMQKGGQDYLVHVYAGGIGTTAINVWCVFVIVLLIFVSLLLIVIPLMAAKLAQGEAMTSPLSAGAGALSAILLHQGMGQLAESTKKGSGAAFNGIMPSSDGTRRRDNAFQGIKDKAGSVAGYDLVSGAQQVASRAKNIIQNGLGDSTSSYNEPSQKSKAQSESTQPSAQDKSGQGHSPINEQNPTTPTQTSPSDIYESSRSDAYPDNLNSPENPQVSGSNQDIHSSVDQQRSTTQSISNPTEASRANDNHTSPSKPILDMLDGKEEVSHDANIKPTDADLKQYDEMKNPVQQEANSDQDHPVKSNEPASPGSIGDAKSDAQNPSKSNDKIDDK